MGAMGARGGQINVAASQKPAAAAMMMQPQQQQKKPASAPVLPPASGPPMSEQADNVLIGMQQTQTVGVTPSQLAPAAAIGSQHALGKGKDTAALDAEANDLLAEFDDLRGRWRD